MSSIRACSKTASSSPSNNSPMYQKLPKKNSTLLAPGLIHIMLIIIVFVIGGVVLAATLIPFRKQQNALAQVGQKAPDFELIDFSANQVKLSDFENKPIVIEFWHSRCLICLEELQILEKAKNDYPDVAFLGIHVNSSIENHKRASDLINRLAITFSQLEDANGEVYKLYKFSGGVDPYIYFIDKNNTVIERFSGLKTENEIRAQIQNLTTQ